jgi:hypothetical protein
VVRYRERGGSERSKGSYEYDLCTALSAMRSLRCASSSWRGRQGGADVASGQDSRAAAAYSAGCYLSEKGHPSEWKLGGGLY